MHRGLFICVFAFAPLPALAGERAAPTLKPAAPAVLLRDASITYGRKPALPLAATPAPAEAKPLPFTLPANSARLEARRPQIETRVSGQGTADNYDLVAHTTNKEWDLTPGADEATSSRGGTYAVRDILRAQTRRSRRGGPLAAALVFRLDGQEESEPFSIGGGGVAAALWQVMPKQ